MPVEKPVTFPYANNLGNVLTVSAKQFRNAWKRFATLHRQELDQDLDGCLPLLASKDSLSDTRAAGHGCGFDVLCREIVGACHWDTMQAGNQFFKVNAHIVELFQRSRPGAPRRTKHVSLLPAPQA
jgi:hypothetical protein